MEPRLPWGPYSRREGSASFASFAKTLGSGPTTTMTTTATTTTAKRTRTRTRTRTSRIRRKKHGQLMYKEQTQIRRPAGVSDCEVLFLFLFLFCTCFCSWLVLVPLFSSRAFLLRLNQSHPPSPPPYVRHLEAVSQAKRLWINTNQKAAKQTIGAKWTQLIPPASGRNRLSRKTCR